ncbi:MAG: tetratricopeptide repeat protein [Bacteroidetes bacterium]|nr:tetratricopeptide repeat protein [Bacteroidota bacterium]
MKYIALLLLLLAPAAMHAQWIDDPAIDALIKDGIHDTYNMKFESADAAFQKVAKAYPDHPAGPFFLAMVEWWRILIEIEDESRDDRFYDMLDAVIDMCDERLDKNENDVAGLFFKGGSIGFKGRLLANRKSWVKAATTGKEALPVVMDAAELAPDNADLAFGTGIYDYYAAVLPDRYPVLKPLMVFLPEGNKKLGLKELRQAAEKGKYANYEAMYFLMQVYYSNENKPSSALTYVRKLLGEFPDNPVFHRYLGRIYIKLGNWERAAQVFADIVRRVDAGKRGYSTRMQREAQYYLGYNSMLEKNPSEAMKYLVECDKLSRKVDDEPSGFMIMANLRMGQLHDMMDQRSYALKQYDKVLRMPDFKGSHDMAKKYKKTAYVR